MPSGNPVLQLETYFLFPFVVDKEVVASAHPDFWPPLRSWIDGLDDWLRSENCATEAPIRARLGGWRRASYTEFDLDSSAYQDMVFFHPFVRRVFFDTKTGDQATQLRVFEILLPETLPLLWEAHDVRGRACSVPVTDLRLFLFANGVGILSIGVERKDCTVREALWMNEMMRKVYPTSGRQRREGRVPALSRLALGEETLASETFESGAIVQFQPPLSKVIQGLLYFLNYDTLEYEQIFDERMIPYSYMAVDPEFGTPEKVEQLFSRFLFVDRDGEGFRYDPAFTREQLREHTYTRWAHEGTYYGFTRFSNVTLVRGVADRGLHQVQEGNLIERMFSGRYYLMAIVALFYRATLLDFAESVALVSRRLYENLAVGRLERQNVEIATDLRNEFLNFSNYWYFDELANKDEEIEHFQMQCRAYRVEELRVQIEQELTNMNSALNEYNQYRSTEAVNRLAMLSMLFGAGAVLTGFFGMNFGHVFERYLFNPGPDTVGFHLGAVALATLITLSIFLLAVYLVVTNWRDYRFILRASDAPTKRHRWFSLRLNG
ncbi:MAG: hypothetical protein EXQ57_11070 [Bryobacterales bacterium]|nr:hypothetical protein [Bryobacterales bacterium]